MSLDALIKKKMEMQEQPDHYTLTCGDIELDVSKISDNEIIQTVGRISRDRDDIGDAMFAMFDECKMLLYNHCDDLREFAKQNPPKGEPWDCVNELFTLGERNELYGQLMELSGMTGLMGGTGKNA